MKLNMKNTVIATLIAASCATAQAEWTEIGANNDGNTYHVDSSTFRRQGSTVKFWVLADYKTAQSHNGANIALKRATGNSIAEKKRTKSSTSYS